MTPGPRGLPEPVVLPDWPTRTVAVFVTLDEDGPHAIPVSAPVRAREDVILISLRRDRDSLARLRACDRVAITILTEADIAFTARGRARVVADRLDGAPDYVALAIDVHGLDDHRQAEFVITAGVDREWLDAGERQLLGRRVTALRDLALD